LAAAESRCSSGTHARGARGDGEDRVLRRRWPDARHPL